MTLDLSRFWLVIAASLRLRRRDGDAIPRLSHLALSAHALRDLHLPVEIAARIDVARELDTGWRRPFA
jgi:hypothetical protein